MVVNPSRMRFAWPLSSRRLSPAGRLLLACLLPAVLLAQHPVSAGLMIEPVKTPAAAEQAMAVLEAADRQALRQRLIEADARLERERQAIIQKRQAAADRLGRLESELAHLQAGIAGLAGSVAGQRQEVLVRERRLAALLAEIVQLSRGDNGDRHRLAQLQAVAAGLARPFADAKAALATSEAEAAAVAAEARARQHETAAARLELATLARRGGRLAAARSATRQAATALALRAEVSRQTAALAVQRRTLAEAAGRVSLVRPSMMRPTTMSQTMMRGAAVRRAATPLTADGRRGLAAAPSARLEAPGLRARATIARPSLPRPTPLGAAGMSVAATAAGTELVPVAGVVVRRFGEGKRPLYDRGITIEVDDRRLVRAPRGGEVVFAGPYAGFGLLLIIDHGGEYHSLLSGLSRLVVDEGRSVQAGQMVGTLEPGPGDLGQLYLELRRSGVPVDPLSWFASGQHKVRS